MKIAIIKTLFGHKIFMTKKELKKLKEENFKQAKREWESICCNPDGTPKEFDLKSLPSNPDAIYHTENIDMSKSEDKWIPGGKNLGNIENKNFICYPKNEKNDI